MENENSLYSDRPSGSVINFVNMLIVVALIVLAFYPSLPQNGSVDPIPLILGIAMGLFLWFTRHNKYEIYKDRLVIHYGQPRKRVILLTNIAEVQKVLGGKGIFLRQTKAGGLLLRPAKVDEFQQQLDGARRNLGG